MGPAEGARTYRRAPARGRQTGEIWADSPIRATTSAPGSVSV
jgi:hypothetical protein